MAVARDVPFPYVQGLEAQPRDELYADFRDIMDDLDSLQRRADRIDQQVAWTEVSTPTSHFVNSWVNWESAGGASYHQEAGFRRVGDIVELRGLIKNGTVSTTAWTLPLGYWPGGGHHLFPDDRNANSHGRVDVDGSGNVVMHVSSNGYASLDGVRFSVSDDGENGWTAVDGGIGFKNSWVNYITGGWAPAAYRRVGDMVEVRGLIKNGTLNAAAFTLPTGYRPTKTVHFSSETSASLIGHGQLVVEPDGDVVPVSGNNTYFGLFSMRFSVSPPGTEGWTKPTLNGGWSNYDVSLYAPAEYRLIGDEVQLRGLVAGGSGTILTLPEGLRPAHQLVWCAEGSNAHARVDVNTNGAVEFEAGTATYVSLSGISFSVLK